jgi:hypothetical protein
MEPDMDVNTVTSLLPIQYAVEPVKNLNNQVAGQNRNHDHNRTEMRFIGYGKSDRTGNYDDSGKRKKETALPGGLINLYV